MSRNDLTEEVKTVALNLMEGLSCARSLTVAILIRERRWVDIAQLTTDPLHYSCSEDYFKARAASDFLRKYVDLPSGIDKAAVALQKWWAGEHACKKTNDRLDQYLMPSWAENNPRILDFFDRVRGEVLTLIGSCPPSRLDTDFGPGATMSDNSRQTTVGDKMSSVLTLTPDAWVHVSSWMETAWGRAQKAYADSAAPGSEGSREVRGNAFFTVPKDATTDRACGKEPSLNVSYQLPAGKAMRRRMLRSGIDLKDGQVIHRRVACLGSLTGEFATIDLSNASDTVSRALVKLVLPPRWYALLDSLRSPFTQLPCGKWVKLEKFSSMGNGFTFELETVIFCAISRAVCKDDWEWSQILVYGDDIIAPSSRFEDIIAALEFCGFTPNKRKTYGTGAFRESCGGDFFNGEAVRPYYLKEFNHEPQDYISLANGLRRMAFAGLHDDDRWNRVRGAWFRCLDNLPIPIRACRGPQALGDAVIHDRESNWSTKTSGSVRRIRSYLPVNGRETRFEGFAYEVQYALALYLAGKGREKETRLHNGNLSPRDSVTGYKVGWIAYS